MPKHSQGGLKALWSSLPSPVLFFIALFTGLTGLWTVFELINPSAPIGTIVLASAVVSAIMTWLVQLFLRRRQIKLYEEQQRLANIMEVSYDWIWELGPDLRFTYISDRFTEITGVEVGPLLGKTRHEVVNRQDLLREPEKWQAHLDDLQQHRPFRDFIYAVEAAHGQRSYIRLAGKPLFDKQGKFQGYRGIGSDVTAEITAKIRAEQIQTQLLDTIESALEAFALYDADDRLIICNKRYQVLLGLPPAMTQPGVRFEEIIRTRVHMGLYHSSMGDPETYLARRLEIHRHPPSTHEIQLADGRWLQVNEQRTHDQGTAQFLADVTELKTREDRLRQQQLTEKSILLQATVDHLAHGISVFDNDLNVVVWNDLFFTLLNFPMEWKEHRVITFEQMVRYNAQRGEYGTGEVEQLVAERVALARNPTYHKFERVRPDGTVLEIQGNPMPNGGFVTTYTDITERKRTEATLRLSATVLETANESILITDADNRILSVNPAFTRITGYTTAEVVGKKPGFLKSGRHDREFYRTVWDSLHETGSWQGEIWNRRKGGEFFAAWLSMTSIKDDTGHVTNYVSISQDITLRKEDAERVWHQANFDALTGLPNRTLFMDRLSQAIVRTNRGINGFALLFIDLDGFKEVNDRLGHDTGDCLLQETAKRLARAVRASDSVSRLAGDEFTVILNNIPDAQIAVNVVRNIMQSLAVPLLLGDVEYRIQASIGIALYPDHADNATALLKQADTAMYEVKKRGKNHFRFATQTGA